MFGPVPIQTTIRIASMRQIHSALDHIERGDYECAITLAAAAEGMLPEPEKSYFRGKAQKFSESEEIKPAGLRQDLQNLRTIVRGSNTGHLTA